MNNQETVDALESLKLHGMAVEFNSIITLPEQKRARSGDDCRKDD